MSGSKEGSSVQPDISSDKKLLLKLTHLFSKPSWLNVNKIKEQRRNLWIALVVLLVVYLFDWGAVSMGGSNEFVECFCWGAVVEGGSGAVVELVGDGVEVWLVAGDGGSFG